MKRIIFISAALASCLIAAAQTPDTLRIKNVSEVTIITSKDSQTVSLKGSANDPTFRYESSVRITPDSNVSVREGRIDLFNWDVLQDRMEQRRYRDTTFSIIPEKPMNQEDGASSTASGGRKYRRVTTSEFDYLGLGVSIPFDGPAGIDMGGKACSDIFLTVESVGFHCLGNHVAISTGLNVGYRSFRLNDYGIFNMTDKSVTIAEIPSGMELKRSALRSNYVSVPGLLTLSFGRHGQLELYGGAEICFNFNGRIKNKYTQEAPGVPQKFTNVRLETWTWNYIAGINFGDLGVYAKYSPCPFLEKGYGPAFNSYSAGIVLNL